jgi:hypothetical protein
LHNFEKLLAWCSTSEFQIKIGVIILWNITIFSIRNARFAVPLFFCHSSPFSRNWQVLFSAVKQLQPSFFWVKSSGAETWGRRLMTSLSNAGNL